MKSFHTLLCRFRRVKGPVGLVLPFMEVSRNEQCKRLIVAPFCC